MREVFSLFIVMSAIYLLLKTITDFFLKRRIIQSGHIDKADILDSQLVNTSENKYPTLKWGLVAFFAGVGLILIDVLDLNSLQDYSRQNFALPFGIELVAVALGFLTYFFIVSARSSK